MGRMKKRLVAWFMVMTMVVTAVPVSVLAANEKPDISPVIEEENLDNDDESTYVEDILPEGVDGVNEPEGENSGNARIIKEPSCILDEEAVGENTNPANVTEIKILELPTMKFVEGTPFHGNILNGIKVKIKYGDNREIDFELADENNIVNLDGAEYIFGYEFNDENRNKIMDNAGNWKSGDHTLILTLRHNSGGMVTSLDFLVSVETTEKFFGSAENLKVGEVKTITNNHEYLTYKFTVENSGIYSLQGIEGGFREAWFFDENYKNVNFQDEETGVLWRDAAKCEAGKAYYLLIRNWTVINQGKESQLKVVNSNPANITRVDIVQRPTIECLEGTSFYDNALDGMKVKVKYDGNKEEEYELTNGDNYIINVDGEEYGFNYWPSFGIKDDVMDENGNWKEGSHKLMLYLRHRESGREVFSSEIDVKVKGKKDFLGIDGDLKIGEIREITGNKNYLTYKFTAVKTGIYSLINENAGYNRISFFDSAYNYVDVPDNISGSLRMGDVYCNAGETYYLMISGWKLFDGSQTSNLKVVNVNPANVNKLEIKESFSMKYLEGDPYYNFSLNGMKVEITYGENETFDYEFKKDKDWTIELEGEKYSFTYGYFSEQEESIFDENKKWKAGTHKLHLNIQNESSGMVVRSCDFDVEVKSLEEAAIPVTLDNTSNEVTLSSWESCVFSFKPEQAGAYKALLSTKAEGGFEYQLIDTEKSILKTNGIWVSPNENPERAEKITANMKAGSLYYIKLRFNNDDDKTVSIKLTVNKNNYKQVENVQMTQQPQINYVEGIDWDVNLTRFVAELTYDDNSVTSIYGMQESDDGYYAVWNDSAIERDNTGKIKAGKDYETTIVIYSPEDEIVNSFPVNVTVKTKEGFFSTAGTLAEGESKDVSGDKEYLVYKFIASDTGIYKVLSKYGGYDEELLYSMNYELVEYPNEENGGRYPNTVYCEKGKTYYLVIKGWRSYSDNESQLSIVKARKINNISLVTVPVKTNYFIWGENYEGSGGLDFSGLSVKVSYSDGTSEVLQYGDFYTAEGYQINCRLEDGYNSETPESGEYLAEIRVEDKGLVDAFKINVQSSFEYCKANASQTMHLDNYIEGKLNINEIPCFTFTPTTNGAYLFESLNGRGYLYDSTGEEVGSANRYNDKISAELKSGETYYYGIRSYGDEGGYKVKVCQINTIDSITLNVPEKVKSYVAGLQDKTEDAFWSGLSVTIVYADENKTSENLPYGEENKYGYSITLDGQFMEANDEILESGSYPVDVHVGTKTASFDMNVISKDEYFSIKEFESLNIDTPKEVHLKESLYQTFTFTAPKEGYYRAFYQELTDTGDNVFLWVFDEKGEMLESGTILLEKGQKVFYVLNNIWGKESTYQFSVKNLDYVLERIEIIQEPYKKLYVDKLDCRLTREPELDFTGLKVRAYYSDEKTEDLELSQPNRDGVFMYSTEHYNFDEEPLWAGFKVNLDGISTENIVKYPYITLEKYISDHAKDIPAITLNSEEAVNVNRIGEIYSFVPTLSGQYQYYTTGDNVTQGSILDASGKELISAKAEENNFAISYRLDAGNTYYFLVNSLNYGYDLDTTVHLTKNTVPPYIPDVNPPTPDTNTDITVDITPEKKEDGTIVIPETIPPTQIADIEKSLEQADENKEMVINIPQSEGTATEIPADIISKAIESNVDTLKIQTTAVDGDKESIDATFTIDVSKGTQLKDGVGSINTGIKATIGDAADKIANEKIPDDAKTMKLELAHEGPFPVPVTITLSVGKLYNPGDVVYLYYINEKTGKVELIGGGPLTVTAEGKVDINLEHASSYVLTDKPEIEEEPSIKLDVKSTKLEAGKTRKLKVTVIPADSKIAWKSSNSKIVSVDENGSVKGIKPGTATITATADSGLTATCKVTVVITKMPAPSSVKAVSGGYNSIKITWKKVNNTTTYYVYRATSKNGKYKRIGTAKENSYTDKKLSTGKTYYYKVKSGYKKVYSPVSKITSAYPRPQRPVVKAKGGKKAVTLSWKRISGATGYTIYRASSKNGKYSKVKVIESGKTVKYTDKSLKSKKTYYYKVRANRKINSKKMIQSISSKISYAKTK